MTKSIDLEAIGISAEELQERVVDRIAERALNNLSFDEYGDPHARPSALKRKIDEEIQKRIDEAVTEIADKHILPNVSEYVETLTLQTTNKWGEKKGEPITFIEYLVERAHAYMTEEVDWNGKTKGVEYGSFRKAGTRVAFMIDKHLQFNIEQAMTQALREVNGSIAKGLEETVKMKLAEILQGLKVTTKVR